MSLRWTRIENWLSPLVYLSKNWTSRAGVVVVTSATVLWLFLLPSSIRGEVRHPYIGILAFLILPGIFFFGLGLIPLGIWLHSRAERKAGHPLTYHPLSLRMPELKQLLWFIGVTTLVNIAIGSQLMYRAVTYMDSVSFCGLTCHRVMQPEYTAYQNSPHSRVDCVACHIGPGASWFVRSKLSGIGQVFAVTFNTYPRPIPTPVRNLRPARETCEQCHWPQKFEQDRLKIINNYADDESNTLTKTVLLMRISGGGAHPGIHTAHLGRGVNITYNPADESRQTISRVEYHNSVTGRTVVFTSTDAKPESLKGLATREMDCMDCHDRPTHTFQMPNSAVNDALFSGSIPATLPFIKKTAVELLRKEYKSQAEAGLAITAAIADFYQKNHPQVWATRRGDISRAAKGVVAIYDRNVFPQMRVTWGTYPNNIGHMDFPGCFRCHDGSHVSTGGAAIPNDCNTCHITLAVEEAAPKILTDLGLANGASAP
jgi:nitrate/TMAO reductase-like tetraheme cytochrome c subunit